MAFEFVKSNIKLFTHQIEAIKFMSGSKKGLIALPTGSGKTLMSIVYAMELFKRGIINKIVWVTIPSISYQVEETIEEFIDEDFYNSNFKLVDLTSKSKNQRHQIYSHFDEYNFIIINYEKLRTDIDYFLPYLTDQMLVILDEVQKAKNPNSQTGKAVILLTKNAKRLLALTATPVMRDLWDLVNILNITHIMEINPNWFKNRFCYYKPIRIKPIKKGNKIIKQVMQFVGYKNVKEFYGYISNKTFFRRKKDIMEMPPVSIHTLRINKIHKDIKEAIERLKVSYLFEKDTSIPLSLIDIAETAPYLILKEKKKAPKIDLIMDFINDNVDKKILVYSPYKLVVKYSQKFVKKYYDTDSLVVSGEETKQIKQIKEQFLSDDKYKILFATDTIATGFDGLQKVADTIILLNLPNTVGQYTQLIGRLYRTGFNFNNINIVVPIIKGLVSEKKWFNLHSMASLLIKSNESQLEKELFDKYLLDTISDKFDDDWVKSQLEKEFGIKIKIPKD